ncbi:MAG: hypothetical protein L0Y45_05260 [Woeseiaceae bacterium]|nr:hypothetical protein [Woeseiaceae bacterium]
MTTYHGTSGASGNGVTSISFSHDFGTGSNRAAGVHISHNGTVSGVTIGGVSCTQKGSGYTGSETSYTTDIWALSAPASGSQTVVVSFSASSAGQVTVISMTDAEQTTANLTGTRANASVTDSSPTITVTSANGDLVVAHTASTPAFTPVSPGTGVTELRDDEAIFISQWTAYKAATSTSTVIDGTATGFEGWGMSGIAYKSASGGQTVAVGQVTETDTAQALGRLKRLAVGQVVETDLAQALSRLKLLTVGQVIETDIAQALSRLKRLAVGQVTETDLAQAIARRKTLALGQVIEADTAQAIAWNPIRRLLGQVLETDTAQLIRAGAITVAVVQAIETDTALPITALVYVALVDGVQTIVIETINSTTVQELLLVTSVIETINAMGVVENAVETTVTQH